MNILISVDKNYIDKAKTMLFSLSMHTKDKIVVYLLNHRLKKSEVEEFANYLMRLCEITVVEIDVKDTELDNCPVVDENYTIEMYYRILAQYLLPQEMERVLWLDCDIIILKSIDDFYYQDFLNAKYVVCLDRENGTKQLIEHKVELGLSKDSKYFNSGVMLMNLVSLREFTNRDEIIKKIEMIKDKLLYPDQDVLNVLYEGEVKCIDGKEYNYQVGKDKIIPSHLKNNVAILHYCSSNKPWIYYCINDVSIYYWRVKAKQGKKEKKNSKNVYKNKIVDCFIELKKYIAYYFSL